MANFNGFLDNLAFHASNPKRKFADFRHASRTFVDDSFRLAPKQNFSHGIYIWTCCIKIFPKFEQRLKLEAGLLVKSADISKYPAVIDTRKKYNRAQHVQTSIKL